MAAAGVERVSQYIGMAPIDENDWGQDSVFSKWDLIVEPENQAEYAAAFAKMTTALSEDTDIRSYGLGSIGYGRNNFTTGFGLARDPSSRWIRLIVKLWVTRRW